MFLKFWDKLAEGLTSIWETRTLIPAIAFWSGGLVAWVWSKGWEPVTQFVEKIDTVEGVVTTIAGLLLLAASLGLIQWFSLPVLRLAEGYWPRLLAALRDIILKRLGRKLDRKEAHWQDLAGALQAGQLEGQRLEEYTRLDTELATYPVNPALRMPTRLGNILRAAEEYPYVRYGLEITITWPRLWLVLPNDIKKEITAIRQALDEDTQLMIWGLLFSLWSVWAWWAFPIALSVIFIAYRSMLNTAGVYGELLRAAFDLHRIALYKALNWPLPQSPEVEPHHGLELTQYLHRGTVPGIQFKSS